MELTISVNLLFTSVLTLFCFIIPGVILRRTKIANDHFAKALSIYTLYIAQIAMLLHGFITKFDPAVFKGVCNVGLLAFIVHALFYIIAKQLFKKAPDKIRRVLQFGIIFSNAGYMGIPVISDVFGEAFTIYATIYVVWFNIFAFSLGRLIYTDDKKYMSIKQAMINPAVIPIFIGLVIYLTGVGGWIRSTIDAGNIGGRILGVLYNVMTVLKNSVAPASMVVIGVRLADIDFKGIFKDKYMYPFIILRLLVFPAMIWLIMKGFLLAGIIDTTVMAIVLILCSTPSAAVTTMFAELYDGDSPYAGKLVAVTTILSVITMPTVALLMSI